MDWGSKWRDADPLRVWPDHWCSMNRRRALAYLRRPPFCAQINEKFLSECLFPT
jgi:hypothetical protein